MPVAGIEVANELEEICTKDKCYYIIDFLNRLYLFKAKYSIYKEELAK